VGGRGYQPAAIYWVEQDLAVADGSGTATCRRMTQGELFATGSGTKHLAVVTNRTGAAAALIRWHWRKAGTIELVHDVTKNEPGAAVPPCERFGANAAWYRLSLFTYNVLSAMKSLALPAHLSAARPKRLGFALFTLSSSVLDSRAGP